MRGLINLMMVVSVSSLFAGCALNPYQEETSCPLGKNGMGKCISTMDAYEEAVTGVSKGTVIIGQTNDADNTDAQTLESDARIAGRIEQAQIAYHQAVYKKMRALIEDGQTPVMVPPKQRRTFITAHTVDDDRLFIDQHFIYYIEKGARWSLVPEGGAPRTMGVISPFKGSVK